MLEVTTLLLHYVNIQTLLQLAKVSQPICAQVQEYLRSIYCIERDLQDFFEPPEIPVFRFLQKRTGLVMSGSFALRFITCTVFSPTSDLDLYVQSSHVTPVLQWLEYIGYVCTKHWQQYPGFAHAWIANQGNNCGMGPNLKHIFDFEQGGRKIQIIICWGSPLSIVLEFHSTCVMNIITHNKVYCLYPRATLIMRKSLIIYRPGLHPLHSLAAIEKYQQHSWDMISYADPLDIAFPSTAHCVGDQFCYCIPLGGPGEQGDSDVNPVEGNTWQLRESSRNPGQFIHSFVILRLPVFKFAYICARSYKLLLMTIFARSQNGNNPLLAAKILKNY
ncbi:hypothetical protein BJ165DRAFT_1357782 [Panaeolus papilionaceus]|nr:hypothetical protein BJ165DRAFT_1357782 [Panaeolus papilionaceus]